MKRFGFQEKLVFIPETPSDPHASKRCKCISKIIWFTPPYLVNVKTNIGEVFLNLLHKHFPSTHLFQKIFNKNTAKISYSCMRNMNSIISAHNRSILNPPKTNYGCNCRDSTDCPLQNQRLTPNIVCQADISNNVGNENKVYSGVSETPFKERYSNHVREIKRERYGNATELPKYVWELKRNNKVPAITWKISRKVHENPKLNFFKLCLIGKLNS